MNETEVQNKRKELVSELELLRVAEEAGQDVKERRRAVEDTLQELDGSDEPIIADVENVIIDGQAYAKVAFRGGAVVGKEGIDAEFAGAIANAYHKLVYAWLEEIKREKKTALKNSGVGKKKDKTKEEDAPSKLLLVGLVRGSVGYLFKELITQTTLVPGGASDLRIAMDRSHHSLEILTNDETDPVAVYQAQPKDVQGPLKGMVKACSAAKVAMRIEDSSAQLLSFPSGAIKRAATKLEDAENRNEIRIVRGWLQGIMPKGRDFEFHDLKSNTVRVGKLEKNISIEAAKIMARDYIRQESCFAYMDIRRQDVGGLTKEQWTLLRLAETEQDVLFAGQDNNIFNVVYKKLEDRLAYLGGLQRGWYDGKSDVGEPIMEGLIAHVRVVFRYAHQKGFNTPSIYPTLKGGIQAEWNKLDWSIDCCWTSVGNAVIHALNLETDQEVEFTAHKSDAIDIADKIMEITNECK